MAYPFAICEKILSGGHGTIQKRVGTSGVAHFERSPDGQFTYPGVKYPHVIFQVGYSHDERSLRKVVTEYFEEMVDTVCTVLAFDIDYACPPERRATGHRHPASVSLWVSEQDFDGDYEQQECDLIIKCLMDTVVFRDGHGMVTLGELALPFRLFIPINERGALPDEAGAELRISFARLSNLIHAAEQRQRDYEADAPAPRIRKVKWLDADGTVARETTRGQDSKRRRTKADSSSTRPRTRSTSQPRRSNQLRSMSRGE